MGLIPEVWSVEYRSKPKDNIGNGPEDGKMSVLEISIEKNSVHDSTQLLRYA